MKFSKYFMLAGAAALFAACSSEEPLNGPQNNQEGEPVGYVKIELGSPEDTRTASSTDVAPDSKDSNIASATFYFYAKGGTSVLETVTIGAEEDDDVDGVWTSEHASLSKSCAIIELTDVNIGEVAVIVNYKPSSGTAADAKVTGDTYKNGDNYIMASAAYYDKNNSNAVTYRTPITKIYSSRDEAVKDEDNATKIYVDRVAAKVNMTTSIENPTSIAISKVTIGNESDEATVTFTPKAVFLTNTAKNAWVRKRLNPYTEYSTSDAYSNAFTSAILSTNNNRAHWTAGCDGGLNKYSYKEIATDATPDCWTTTKKTITKYIFDNSDQNEANYTSIVVAGEFSISGEGLNINEDGDFWIVASGGHFNAYDNATAAIKAMAFDGSDKAADGTNRTLVAVPGKPYLFKLNDDSSPINCMYFKGGLGYYTAPIKHFSFDNNKDEYFGIVRNNIYNVDVNAITGLGIGIPDPTKPIDPVEPINPANEKSFLHVTVNVHPWVIHSQDISW